MPMILEEIVANTRQELVRRKEEVPVEDLRSRCRVLPPTREFYGALGPRASAPIRLIAEIKKASPSKGVFQEAFDPVSLAQAYEANGAAAISVLTDGRFFQGSLFSLAAVRARTMVPLLRKDFHLEEYQLWEARAWGADAVLLITAILPPPLLRDLWQTAKGLGLGALVEVHTRQELETVLAMGCECIGINNRDLRTFHTDLSHTLRLLPLIPPGKLVVSESGFRDRQDVLLMARAGVSAVLVGESLILSPDPGAKVRELSLLG